MNLLEDLKDLVSGTDSIAGYRNIEYFQIIRDTLHLIDKAEPGWVEEYFKRPEKDELLTVLTFLDSPKKLAEEDPIYYIFLCKNRSNLVTMEHMDLWMKVDPNSFIPFCQATTPTYGPLVTTWAKEDPAGFLEACQTSRGEQILESEQGYLAWKNLDEESLEKYLRQEGLGLSQSPQIQYNMLQFEAKDANGELLQSALMLKEVREGTTRGEKEANTRHFPIYGEYATSSMHALWSEKDPEAFLEYCKAYPYMMLEHASEPWVKLDEESYLQAVKENPTAALLWGTQTLVAVAPELVRELLQESADEKDVSSFYIYAQAALNVDWDRYAPHSEEVDKLRYNPEQWIKANPREYSKYMTGELWENRSDLDRISRPMIYRALGLLLEKDPVEAKEATRLLLEKGGQDHNQYGLSLEILEQWHDKDPEGWRIVGARVMEHLIQSSQSFKSYASVKNIEVLTNLIKTVQHYQAHADTLTKALSEGQVATSEWLVEAEMFLTPEQLNEVTRNIINRVNASPKAQAWATSRAGNLSEDAGREVRVKLGKRSQIEREVTR